MEKNMKMWIWVGVAVVIIAAIIFLVSQNNSTLTPPGTTVNPPSEQSESVQDISDQDGGVVAEQISYANALVKYADRRLQIDTECRMYPSNITYKDNTGIMIDNRSPKTRTVKIGTTFTIKPYGFKIFVLPDVYLKSKTLLVDCDQSQNVATVLVQE